MYMDETDVFSKARDRAFTASQVEVNILFWRNMAVAFCVGTGMALSVAANLSLSHWDDLDETLQEKLPAIFTGALAVNFFNITVIIYLFARHVMRLVTVMYTQEDHTEQEDTPVSRHSLMGLLPSVVPPKRNPKKRRPTRETR
ncbi:expressed unknown protein [Seminavis robusta]|uniref:Uncharacterized protein n=1 Tax=Seminavis robusta TaxID=568900 RepID=A0A9N8HXB8_9STRA|nr:expressed unknown protein [Seminavis robusta]|eukprot:Sro2443_g327840.1 n/a (143) ;mRNA; r:3201-3710